MSNKIIKIALAVTISLATMTLSHKTYALGDLPPMTVSPAKEEFDLKAGE